MKRGGRGREICLAVCVCLSFYVNSSFPPSLFQSFVLYSLSASHSLSLSLSHLFSSRLLFSSSLLVFLSGVSLSVYCSYCSRPPFTSFRPHLTLQTVSEEFCPEFLPTNSKYLWSPLWFCRGRYPTPFTSCPLRALSTT